MRSCLALPACFALAACGFDGQRTVTGDGGGDAPLDDAGLDDAPADARVTPDAPVDPLCFGTTDLTRVCLAALPTTSLRFEAGDPHGDNLGSIYTNAGSDPLCVQLRVGEPNLCVIAATSITITRGVGTYGPRPIVFLATEGPLTITATGSIDSASGQPGSIGQMGPGSGLGPCEAPAANGNGGGAAGGSFGALGGPGGGSGTGGIGGQPGGVTTPAALRGGCAGGNGKGPGGGGAGPGGLGGGAIALIANAIDVQGFVNASGGGGAASDIDNSGGGGGGSGGLIVLDTPNLTVGGKLFADGGGGGGGSGSLASNGADGDGPTNMVTPGGGGAGGGNGGDGGDGSSGAAGAGGDTGAGIAGGGGGGGGAGVITTTDPTPPSGDISPPFS